MGLPYPVPDDVRQPFWDGVAANDLRLQACDACGTFIHIPEFACPHCGSEALSFRSVSRQGALYAWTRIADPPDESFADIVPFTLGVVELAEQQGLLLSAPFAKPVKPVELTVGAAVEIVFASFTPQEATLPMIHLLGAGSQTVTTNGPLI